MAQLASFAEHKLIKKKVKKRELLYTKPYNSLSTHQRYRKMVEIASDAGRCWWIKKYLMSNQMKLNY